MLSRPVSAKVFQTLLSSDYKRRSMSLSLSASPTSKIIGTHNGTFHCDEALAVFLLRQTNAYRDAAVKRSRDPGVLAECDIVVDVGGVYDQSKQLFDHHQRGFTEVFGNGYKTKLSSAGLVYKHFGKEVISNRTKISVGDPKVDTLWIKLYKEFIEAIDAIDNGITQYPSDIEPKYRNSTDLSSRVGALNPRWNQSLDSQAVDAQFKEASLLTGKEFIGKLDYYSEAWLPARDILISAVLTSKSHDGVPSEIILLEQFLPWKDHLFELEADEGFPALPPGEVIYIVYPDETAGQWRVQAVPIAAQSFESRKALPEAWRGLRDHKLDEATGIDGCVFVHASGFIGGNKTKSGALLLARSALEM